VNVSVRRARDDEGKRLKEIAIDAKSYWGYERVGVIEWADKGDFTPERLRELIVFVAEAGGQAIGWASLIPKQDVWWLEDLWIDPEWIGRGVGTTLFRQAADHAASLGATRLEWEAEPNAIGFYDRMGGEYVRDSGVTEFGRRLPVMGVDVRAVPR
jgi:GNAT superfamily N-acetyltransferase